MIELNSNYRLAIMELYNPYRHGSQKKNSDIYGQYIIIESIDLDEFYNDLKNINDGIDYYHEMCNDDIQNIRETRGINVVKHPFIRNYQDIVANKNMYEINIIQPKDITVPSIYDTYPTAPSDYNTYKSGIIKTHWIRLIQRRWREIQKKRESCKKNLTNLKHRELHGKYPPSCNIPFNLGIY